jgi:hypothetical protein
MGYDGAKMIVIHNGFAMPALHEVSGQPANLS